MIPAPLFLPPRRFRGGFLFALSLLVAAGLGASLSLSPTSIHNRYAGTLDLTITGLDAPGQAVVVEEFFDSDLSGTVTAPDVLLRRFQVTDGQVTSIAGQRNLNIPGDEDGAANGSIVARLLFGEGEIQGRINGPHIFRVSPAGSGFTPFTATLTVTQQTFGGSGVSGTVTASSGGAPQVGALVFFFAGSDGELAGITVTGLGGAYALALPPGSYQAASAKAGFVCDLNTAPSVGVTAATFASGVNIALPAAGRTISGLVRNATTLAPLPALGVIGQSEAGILSFTLSDANGAYVLPAPATPFEIEIDEFSVARVGCLSTSRLEGGITSVTGFHLDQLAGTALICGSLRTPANAPVPFVRVEGETNGVPQYQATGLTDASGNYTLAALPAAWRVHALAPNFVTREETAVVNTAPSAVLQNLSAYPVTAHLRGQVRDDLNQPVGNVVVNANEFAAGPGLLGTRAEVDANGNFDLGVFGGGGSSTKTWTITLNQNEDTEQYVSTVPSFQVQDGVDINNIILTVYRVTAHLRGQVLDELDNPISNVAIFAGTSTLLTGTDTDGSGNFDLGLFAGTWNLGLSNIQGLGIIPQVNPSVTITNGVDQNGYIFRVRNSTGTISGTLRNAAGQGIAGVSVSGVANISGTLYASTTTTAMDGTYAFPVFNANWSVALDPTALFNLGYLSPSGQNVFVTTSVSGVDFVAPSRPVYSAFLTTYFTPTEQGNPAISGPTANPTGDGVVNLLKYAFNLDPKKTIGSPPAQPAPNLTGLPVVGTLSGVGGPFLTLTYRRLAAVFDLQYGIEQSTALGSGFSPISATQEVLSTTGTVETVRARVPIGANPHLFLRLRVTKTQ